MLPLKRILCPTDISEDARSALRVANELALYFSAELTLVHVLQLTTESAWPEGGYFFGAAVAGSTPEEHMLQAHKLLAEEANDCISREVKTKLEVLRGDVANEILDLANRIDAGMIVLATHGHSRFRNAILGSPAEKVVRLSPCPVITLHAGQEALQEPEMAKAEKATS